MEKREKRIKPNYKQKNERKKGAAPKLSAFRGPMSFSPVPLIHPILNLLPHTHNNYIYSTTTPPPRRRCCVVSHFYVMILLYIPFHYYCCCCRRCSVGVVRSLAGSGLMVDINCCATDRVLAGSAAGDKDEQ